MRVPLLNFEGGPRVPLLNFDGCPEVPLLNFRGSRVPTPGVLVPLLYHANKIEHNHFIGIHQVCVCKAYALYEKIIFQTKN